MAHQAKVEMSGQYIGKFQCKIGYGKATPTTRIWVGGLGPWTSLSALEREFDRFGSIRKIDFVKGDNHAYLQYDSIDAAQAACQEMRGHALGGSDKRLRVDFADPGPYNYNYNSPSRPSNTSSSEHYNASSSRRENNSSTSEGNWPTPPASRYHSNDYGDSYNESRGNSRNRPSNVSSDNYSGNDGDQESKRERGEYSGERGNSNWNYWDDPLYSPTSDRRGKRPRTPEGGDVRKKVRRGSISPDSGNERLASPRRSTRTDSGGRKSPTYELNKSGDDRNRSFTILDSVSTFNDFTKCCPLAWAGGLILKNSAFAARMFHCSGDASLVDQLMKNCSSSSSTSSSSETAFLKITQRLRLDPSKLEDVSRRMTSAGSSGYCMLFTSPGSSNNQLQAGLGEDGRAVQTRPLKNLVTYLKQKEAAGVISLSSTGKKGKESVGVLYAFPPCSFAMNLLHKVAPQLQGESPKEDYLVVVVVRSTN